MPFVQRVHTRDAIKIGIGFLVTITMVITLVWLITALGGGFLKPIRSALATAANVTDESGEVIRTATTLVGQHLKKALNDIGDDVTEIEDTVLHVTKVASQLAAKHLNRTYTPTLQAMNGVSALAGDILDFASFEVRQACWLVACLFLTAENCNEQFYTEFQLCNAPTYNITEGGKAYIVQTPCEYHGRFIETTATQRYDVYVKTRIYQKMRNGVEQMRDANILNFDQFTRLAKSVNIVEHLQREASRECEPQKEFLRKDCYARHCAPPPTDNNMVHNELSVHACLFDRVKRKEEMFV